MSGNTKGWDIPACVAENPSDPDFDQMTHQDYVTYRISMLSGELSRNISRYFARNFDLTLAEGRVLQALFSRAPMSYSEICHRLLLDGAQISRAAASLAGRGLISKTNDPRDARRAIFDLTEAGLEIANRAVKVGRGRQKAIMERLTAEERVAVYSALSKMMDLMTELNEEGRLLGESDAENAA